MASATLTRDSLEWLEWTPQDLTQDENLLKVLADEELNTLGAAWEAQCSGVVKIAGLGEAFDAFFEGYPEFTKVEHPPEPDPPEAVEAIDPTELGRLRQKEQLLDRIRKTATQARALKEDWEGAKESAKEAKKLWEAKVSTLTLLCDSAKTGQMLLPIDERPQDEEPDADEDDEDEDDEDAWRDTPLDDLGVSDSVLKLLRDADVDSLGRLEDLRRDVSEGRGEWPKGIGEAKVTQIEDGVVQWMSSHGR